MYQLFTISAVSGPQHNQSLSLAKQININSIPMLRDKRLLSCGGAATVQSLKVNFWITGTIFPLAMLVRLPINLAARCIVISTAKGDTILDPFTGLGTTSVARIKLGCQAFINPEQILIIKRSQHLKT